MPIYKECTEYDETEQETGGLFYAGGDFRKCTESVFVHLGLGDISIETAKCRSEVSDELIFTQQADVHEIGKVNHAEIGKPTMSPVRVVFDKVASVDVVIDALKDIRQELVARDGESAK